MNDLSRRSFVGFSASLAVWLAAAPAELLAAGDSTQGFRALTSDQAAAFDAFAAHVIPSEPGSPGAREANVVRFADAGLATFAKPQRADFAAAITSLEKHAQRAGRQSFAKLDARRQAEAMRAMDKADHAHFETLRAPVIAGMFANPEYGGNTNKVGWKLIGFEDRFSWSPPFGFYDTDAERQRP